MTLFFIPFFKTCNEKFQEDNNSYIKLRFSVNNKKDVKKIDPFIGGSAPIKNNEKPSSQAQLKKEDLVYSNLFPSPTENAEMLLAGIQNNDNFLESDYGQSDVLTGWKALTARELGLTINIPEQLRKMFYSGKASVKLVRDVSKKWRISYSKGDHFYRALLYERIKPLIDANGAIYDLLKLSGSSVYWIGINYKRESSLSEQGIKQQWQMSSNKLVLYVEELELSQTMKVFEYTGDNEAKRAVLLDVVKAFQLIKKLAVGEDVKPLDQ